jgi:D-glycero-alpha-D-manno-heptose-7-phosphate kinase
VIVVRSPLRLTLCGGGTDLPSYYRSHGGFLIGAAIDKYVWATCTAPLASGANVQHAVAQRAAAVDKEQHPIVREALRLFGDGQPDIGIGTFADVPWGTGLGSSGSFTTALVGALHARRGAWLESSELAEQACHIEIDVLGAPIGKQDQYVAAFGGLNCYTFDPDGSVAVTPLAISAGAVQTLEDRLLLFYTGQARSASDILRGQDALLKKQDPDMVERFHYEKKNAFRSRKALEANDLVAYGRLLHEHWVEKRRRSPLISSPELDRWYEIGLRNGALGGKLMGAGGGGFLMFLAADKEKLRQSMREKGLTELPFRFAGDGTTVVGQ